MKEKVALLMLTSIGIVSYSQTISRTGIGTLIPNSLAKLDVVAPDKGVLLPRVALVGIDSPDPISNNKAEIPNSLLVYNTSTTDSLEKGYYFWLNNKWNKVATKAELDILSANNGVTRVDNNFSLGGKLTEDTTIDTNKKELAITGTMKINSAGYYPTNNVLDLIVGQDGYGYGNKGENYGIRMSTLSTVNPGDIARINFGDTSETNTEGNRYLSFSVGKPLNELMYLYSSKDGAKNYVGIGTTDPAATLHVKGKPGKTLRIVDENQAFGKVLTSDSEGNASWNDPVKAPIQTASNGLTVYGSEVKLGGALKEPTTIATSSGKNLIITGNSANAFSVNINALSVDGFNNRVGIGTSIPSAKLDMLGTMKINSANEYSTSKNILDLIVGQNGGTYGNRGDNWGINISTLSTNNTGPIARINFGDTGQSNNSGNRYLSFSVGKSLNELMYLTSSADGKTNYVGIGTTTPTATLSVNGTVNKPSGGQWGTFSDERMKKNVQPYTKGLNEIMKINPITFQYNGKGGYTEDGKTYTGVLAQEIEKILPSTVTSIKTKDFPDQREYNSSEVIYTLINAIKEQQKQIEKLTIENKDMRAKATKIADLKVEIDAIKALLIAK